MQVMASLVSRLNTENIKRLVAAGVEWSKKPSEKLRLAGIQSLSVLVSTKPGLVSDRFRTWSTYAENPWLESPHKKLLRGEKFIAQITLRT